ncbi:hypothetical protein M5C99_18910 [Acidovorax sp. NCPPB 2350]|nr:hypothetical protein M5C99_18910 [Acidovorax sp. NCPPB 2350]
MNEKFKLLTLTVRTWDAPAPLIVTVSVPLRVAAYASVTAPFASVVELLAVMALPRDDVAVTAVPEMATLPLSRTLTAKLVEAPASIDVDPDAVSVVPATGTIAVWVTLPDLTVTVIFRLERLLPAVSTAVPRPSVPVVVRALASVPLSALNVTGCEAIALFAESLTTAVTVTPVVLAEARLVADVKISMDAVTGVVVPEPPPELVPELPPPPPHATSAAASDNATALINDFILSPKLI